MGGRFWNWYPSQVSSRRPVWWSRTLDCLERGWISAAFRTKLSLDQELCCPVSDKLTPRTLWVKPGEVCATSESHAPVELVARAVCLVENVGALTEGTAPWLVVKSAWPAVVVTQASVNKFNTFSNANSPINVNTCELGVLWLWKIRGLELLSWNWIRFISFICFHWLKVSGQQFWNLLWVDIAWKDPGWCPQSRLEKGCVFTVTFFNLEDFWIEKKRKTWLVFRSCGL